MINGTLIRRHHEALCTLEVRCAHGFRGRAPGAKLGVVRANSNMAKSWRRCWRCPQRQITGYPLQFMDSTYLGERRFSGHRDCITFTQDKTHVIVTNSPWALGYMIRCALMRYGMLIVGRANKIDMHLVRRGHEPDGQGVGIVAVIGNLHLHPTMRHVQRG